MRHQTLLILAVLRLALQVALFCSGLEVVSLDDYLRVSVAHQIAVHWRWFPDPVFLPAYFWLYSIPIKLGVPLRWGAIGLTIGFAVLSTCLVYLLVLKASASRRTALTAGVFWTFQPLPLWLGGAPMSDTMAMTLVLACLYWWNCEIFWKRILACAFLCLATLVRFELWPVATTLILLSIWSERIPFEEGAIRLFVTFSGIIAFTIWRLLQRQPFAPMLFVRDMITDPLEAHLVSTQLFWALLSLAPISAFCGVALFTAIPPLWKNRFTRPVLVTTFSYISIFLGMTFVLGVYVLTYPLRILLLPAALFLILGFIAVDPWINRLTQRVWAASLICCSLLLAPIAFRPTVDIKPETLESARLLRNILASHPGPDSILVERRDLGWTVLWGLNDANPRIVFDRLHSKMQSPWEDPLQAKAFFVDHPDAFCALAASRPGAAGMRLAMPAIWTELWHAGKYTLFCSPDISLPAP